MRPRPQAAPVAKKLTLDARADLLPKVKVIRRTAIELKTSKSIALRSRMNAQVNQLCRRVLELDPPADIARPSQAIQTAFGISDWNAIVAACEPLEAMLENKTAHFPIEEALAAGDAPDLEAALVDVATPVPDAAPAVVAAPVPIAAAPAPAPAATPVPAAVAEPPAVPLADLAAPAPAPAAPKPEQAQRAPAANDQADTAPANDDAPITIAGIAAVEKLGEAIRLGRVSKRMTQQQVATAAGVGRRFVVELESGKGKSEIGRIFAVCQVVGVTLTASAA